MISEKIGLRIMISKTKKFSNGVRIYPIGIGTSRIGLGVTMGNLSDKEEIEALRYSLKKGQNHIDTAELYALGRSEKIVGKAINGFDREKILIATKVWRNNATADRVPRAAEGSLKRLSTGYIDLLYIHACWDENRINDYIRGLNKAQELGYTRTIGLSNFNLKQFKKAVSISRYPVVALQNHYNVIHQYEVDEEMKMFCKKEKIMIVAYSPLENCRRSKEVLGLAQKYDKIPEQIALNWLISQENVVTIPKSTNKTHINENLAAMDFEMEKEDIEKLNNL